MTFVVHHCGLQEDETPLNYAARGGHLDVARLLIEKGAKVDVIDDVGRAFLICVSVVDYVCSMRPDAC